MRSRALHVAERSTGGWDAPTVGLGSLFAVLVAVGIWTSVFSQALTVLVESVGGLPGQLLLMSAVTMIGGPVAAALVYLRYRGLALAWSRPRGGTWIAACGAVLAPAVLVAVVAVVGNALVDVTLSAMVQRRINPEVSTLAFLRVVALPAVFLGVGYAVLFCGVVCERIRDLVGADRVAALATALVGAFWLLPVDLVQNLRLDPGVAVELALSLLFGVAIGMSLGIVYRSFGGDGSDTYASAREWIATLRRREVIVLAVAGLGLVGIGMELAELPRSIGDLLWIAGLGVAIVGYERTRCVWVSAASLTVLSLAISGVVYVEALLGLASM